MICVVMFLLPAVALAAWVEPIEFKIEFIPIKHASFVIQTDGLVVYVDPVRHLEDYPGLPSPDMILIMDIDHDHFVSDLIRKWLSDGV